MQCNVMRWSDFVWGLSGLDWIGLDWITWFCVGTDCIDMSTDGSGRNWTA